MTLSIPGIGPITAAWLMVATVNFTTCQTVEQLVAFAGLAPYPRQSGITLNRTRGIGRGGGFQTPVIYPDFEKQTLCST